MKRTLLGFMLFVSVIATAQKPIVVTEDTFAMSKGVQPGFQVEIPQVTLIEVEKHWLKYVSNGSKGKSLNLNGENLQTGAVNANISAKPFNVYSKLLETIEAVRITAWFTENDTVFLSKQLNNDQDLAVQKYMRDFAVAEYQAVVKDELKAEESKLKALDKDLNGLIKEEEKSAKKVSESNRAIQKSNDNISSNNANIQTVSYKIEDQKGMVERTASDANANKGAKQTLKELENQKKQLQKQNEAEAKNIDAMNKTIREEERNIASVKEKRNAKVSEIEQQKLKIKEVQSKLEGIK